MGYDDLRAELVLTTPDGFRLTPAFFQVPMSVQYRKLEEELARAYRIKELELLTRIGTLEAEIQVLRRPRRRRWFWRRRT